MTHRIFPATLAALLLATWCAATSAGSVSYSTVWDRSLVHGRDQLPRALIRTSDGGYALAGEGSVKLVPGGVGAWTGFWTAKFSREGKIQWQRAFAAELPKRDEEAYTLTKTRDGGLLVVGTTASDSLAGGPLGKTDDPRSPSTSNVGLVIKYSSDGELLWKKVLGSAEAKPSDWFYAVSLVADGYILVGTTMMSFNDRSTPSGQNVAWILRIIKLNDSGETVWDRTVPDGESSIVDTSISTKIAPTTDGFVLAVAPSFSVVRDKRKMDIISDAGEVLDRVPFQRAVVLKFDREGRVVKRAEFPAATEHLAFGANANGYIISGYYKLLWYAFFDTDLNLKWKKTMTPAMKINAFHPAPDGGFYGTGATTQAAIAHINPSGEFRQQTISGMPNDSEGRDIAPGDRPDEFVVLWSRIPQTRAGLIKLRVPLE